VAAVALAGALGLANRAGAKVWVGGSGTWDTFGAWSPAGVPQAGDNVFIGQDGAVVQFKDPAPGTLGPVTISDGATLSIGQQALLAIGTTVGGNGAGVINNSGGTHTTGSFLLGSGAGSTGTYNLSGNGQLNVTANDLQVGGSGSGVFNQSGGSVVIASGTQQRNLYLGGSGTTGTYNMSGGTLGAKFLVMGPSANTTFTHSGGTVTVSASLQVEAGNGFTSTYQLSGSADLHTGFEFVGFGGGVATVDQKGGVHTVTGTLTVGDVGQGVFALSGGTLNTVLTRVGGEAKGTFTQTGGTHAATGSVQVGVANATAGRDLYTIGGGNITANGLTVLSSGRFEQAGGNTLLNGGVSVNGSGLVKISGGSFRATSLSFSPGTGTAAVDLTNQSIVIEFPQFSPAAAVRQFAGTGFNGGPWNGFGLVSSVAAGDAKFGIGYADAADVLGLSGNATATWRGYTVDANSMLVGFALRGDANLDSKVDFADLVRVAQSYNAPGSRFWSQGDFNYDQVVDFNDLVQLAQNYGSSLPAQAIPGAPVNFRADLAAAFASVPEPGVGMGVFAVAGVVLRRRRRRAPH
jgi:hypothetical protein